MKRLLSIWNLNVNSNLHGGMLRYELEDKKGESIVETSITLKNGHFQHKALAMKISKLPSGQSFVTYGYPNKNEFPTVYATESIAVAYQGVIENFNEMSQACYQHSFETKTGSEIILRSISHYLETEFVSQEEAIRLVMKRLRGKFAIMVLFAEEECLAVAHSGYPLFIGADDEMIYVSTDADFLTCVLQTIREVEEGKPLLLG